MLVAFLLLLAMHPLVAAEELSTYDKMILGVLKDHGYSLLATAIELADSQLLSQPHQQPSGYTLFAPSDIAMVSVNLKAELFIPLMRYHIAAGRLMHRDLLSMPAGTRVSTLLFGKSLLITSNNSSIQPLTIDDVPIVLPDLFADKIIVIHGINHILDFQAFGFGMPITLPPSLPGFPASPPPPLLPFLPPFPPFPPLRNIFPFPNFPPPPPHLKESNSTLGVRQSPPLRGSPLPANCNSSSPTPHA